MEGLVEGRIVHFVLENSVLTEKVSGKEQTIQNLICRPAIIVNAWGGKLEDGMINILVFLDGDNDLNGIANCLPGTGAVLNAVNSKILWLTSIKHSENKEIKTWHWPERS